MSKSQSSARSLPESHRSPKTRDNLTSEEKAAKIRQYETFIDQKLKEDLRKIIEARDRVYEQAAEYLKLRNNILMMQEQNSKELKTMINLGSEFYMQAKVPDCTKIFVHIGLGFHLEMSHTEALEFIAKKEKDLQKRADELSKKAALVKARIKIMVSGVNQLMDLPDPAPKPRAVF